MERPRSFPETNSFNHLFQPFRDVNFAHYFGDKTLIFGLNAQIVPVYAVSEGKAKLRYAVITRLRFQRVEHIGLQPDAMINVQLAANFYTEEDNEAGQEALPNSFWPVALSIVNIRTLVMKDTAGVPPAEAIDVRHITAP